MSMTGTVVKTTTIGGQSFSENIRPVGDGVVVHNVSVPAGNSAELTTRGSATAGTATIDDSGHLITTGAVVDLYWTVGTVSGSRRGVTVGTVSGSSVPFSGGSGDDLPIATSDIRVCIRTVLDVIFDGTNAVVLAASSAVRGQVAFMDGSVEALGMVLGTGTIYTWHNADGSANPITGDTIDTVCLSHGSATAQTMKVGVIYNN